jgi:hypothetical protein
MRSAERIHLRLVASAFLGRFSGLADRGDVQRDEDANSGCNRRNRLDFLKPKRRLIDNI